MELVDAARMDSCHHHWCMVNIPGPLKITPLRKVTKLITYFLTPCWFSPSLFIVWHTVIDGSVMSAVR